MINNNKYWKNYNSQRTKLVKKIVDYNNKIKFNFIEKEHFNHTRDILALTLASLESKRNKKVRILDFGSNLLTLANLNNKIDTRRFEFTIYDPFALSLNKLPKIKNIKYKIKSNIEGLFKKSYDLINFASSIQYQDNFFENFEFFKLNKTKIIIFTSTPLSLKKTYKSKQINHPNLTQNVYSFKILTQKLKLNKFKLIFKSRNDDKYISCKKRIYKTLSLNLIFKK